MNILFVCTGNICRSPMAKQMLQQRLETLGVKGATVTSAGTAAMTGHGLDVETAAAMELLGFETKDHSAQQLTQELIRGADLVLTATAEQRSDVVELLLAANRYSFTTREFAALAEYVIESGTKANATNHVDLLDETKMLRGYARTLPDLDITDPYQRGAAETDRVARETKQAVELVAQWLS